MYIYRERENERERERVTDRQNQVLNGASERCFAGIWRLCCTHLKLRQDTDKDNIYLPTMCYTPGPGARIVRK